MFSLQPQNHRVSVLPSMSPGATRGGGWKQDLKLEEMALQPGALEGEVEATGEGSKASRARRVRVRPVAALLLCGAVCVALPRAAAHTAVSLASTPATVSPG